MDNESYDFLAALLMLKKTLGKKKNKLKHLQDKNQEFFHKDQSFHSTFN